MTPRKEERARGRCGKCKESLQRIAEQLPERPCTRPGSTLHILVLNVFGAKSNPAENTFGKPVIFPHRENRVHHLSCHKAKILRTVYNFRLRNLVHDLVEFSGEPRQQLWLSFSAHASCCGTVIFTAEHIIIHLRQKCRRMLQIRIHDNDIITRCIFQTGEHAGFFSKIPGKRDIPHSGICFCQFPEFRQRSVP